MGTDRLLRLSRRDLLRAVAFGSVAAGITACGAPPTFPPTSADATASASPGATPASASMTPAPGTPAPGTPDPGTPAPSQSADPGLTLRQKIGQLLVVGLSGLEASKTSPVGRAIASGELGGVILFDRNIASPSQLGDLTGELRTFAPDAVPLLIAVDQEGGKVLRLGPLHGFPDVPSQQTVGTHRVSYAATVYGHMATTLADAGINLNLAPVVDVNVNPRNPAIGALERSFSADPAVVTEIARAAILADHDHDVRAVIKHFPGLGSAAANTDFAVVDVTKTWSQTELGPFRDLVDGVADCVMVGHINNGQLDAKWPASLSKASVNGLLRDELGWQGPVITDDMQAKAITARFKRSDAIVAALNAGVDLLLFAAPTPDPGFYIDLVDSIEALVMAGTVSESRIDEAVARAATLRLPV